MMIAAYVNTATGAFAGAPVVLFTAEPNSGDLFWAISNHPACATFQMRDIPTAERTFSSAMESACLEIIIHVLSPRFCVK